MVACVRLCVAGGQGLFDVSFQEDSDSHFGPYQVAPVEGSDMGPVAIANVCMVMGYQVSISSSIVHQQQPADTPPTLRPVFSTGRAPQVLFRVLRRVMYGGWQLRVWFIAISCVSRVNEFALNCPKHPEASSFVSPEMHPIKCTHL